MPDVEVAKFKVGNKVRFTIGVSKESKVKYCSFSTDKYRVSKVCMKTVRCPFTQTMEELAKEQVQAERERIYKILEDDFEIQVNLDKENGWNLVIINNEAIWKKRIKRGGE